MRLADNSDFAPLHLGTASTALQVGTHSAIGAETRTGFITIKDSGGTDRKTAKDTFMAAKVAERTA